MRKTIAFVAITAFIATTSLGLAATKRVSHEGLTVSGKVSAIEDGILSLKESNGQTFNVAAESDKLKGIEVGDRVTVRDVNGWAVSINKMGKTEMKQHTKQVAKKHKTAEKKMSTPKPVATPKSE